MAQTLSSRSRRADDLARPIASSLALPEQHVGLIDQSHERCQAIGLSRIERPDYAPLGRTDLTVVRDRNRRLHSHAAPVMEMLFDQIVGTESMVVLCDATGTIIHSVGDDEFLARASKVALASLVDLLRARGYELLDTQWVTPHLEKFGACEIPRDEYLEKLGRAVLMERSFQGPTKTRSPALRPSSTG